jgi:hypothetical protein
MADVDDGDRQQNEGEDQAGQKRHSRDAEALESEKDPATQFDERVLPRNRRPTARAPSVEKKEAEDRNIEIPGNRRSAKGAMRTWENDGFPSGNPPSADVSETAERQTDKKEKERNTHVRRRRPP